MDDSDTEDTSWHEELAAALLENCDFGRLRNICNGRQIPQKFKAQAWKICLNVSNKADSLSSFDGIFDLQEQAQLRKDCKEFSDKFDNSEEEKLSVASDLESVITFYCKSKNVRYESNNGWLDILGPLVALRMERSDLYNCFYALITKYIPRETQKESPSFQLFRLLLMYHEPDMCNFLDTRKIFPDAYSSSWFRSIFASSCGLEVVQPFWTLYLLQADPFLTFFLGVVILVNAKDHVQSLEGGSPEEIAEALASFPSQLEVEDISDFFSLAQYYASKTPQSFRRDYQAIFSSNLGGNVTVEPLEHLQMALCLQVNPAELFQAILQGTGENVSYFVVDCRPADQYNKSHLATAFYLDSNLMLQQPQEFASAVKALFTAQKQAIDAESQAAGEHLCFLGTGREEEDQYLHMVVANFLQKKTQYVSIVCGGYAALLKLLEKESEQILKSCIVSQPDAASSDDSGTFSVSSQLGDSPQKLSEKGAALMGRFTSTLRTKGGFMKDKMVEFIKNEGGEEERHVRSEDTGTRYRNMQSVFTIADDDEEGDHVTGGNLSSDEERRELVNTDVWLQKPDVLKYFQCQEVKTSGHTYPGHVLLTAGHLYILREAKDRKNFSYIMARRPLREVVRITSKKRCTELITFRYGRVNKNNETIVYAIDRLYLPEAPEATKLIKQQIVTCIEGPEAIRKLDRREEQALEEEKRAKENQRSTTEDDQGQVKVGENVEEEVPEKAEEVIEDSNEKVKGDPEVIDSEQASPAEDL